MKWLILLAGVASNASASVLIKYAVSGSRKFPSFSDPLAALMNWPFWLGLSLYGVAFLLYALALQSLPLNTAHPILTAGSICVVAILSKTLFGEVFHISTVVGVALIVIGVVILTVSIE